MLTLRNYSRNREGFPFRWAGGRVRSPCDVEVMRMNQPYSVPSRPASGLASPSPPDLPSDTRASLDPPTPALVAALRAVVSSIRGIGGAIYLPSEAGAEIVVGIGRGLPAEIEAPSEAPLAGLAVPGGRIWALGGTGETPGLLFVSLEEDGSAPPTLGAPFTQLRRVWRATAEPLGRPRQQPSEVNTELRPISFEFPELIGSSSALQNVLRLIERIAATRVSVLILGESGTGKELVGRALHRLSRRKGRFVSENCAAISDSLLEGELFGTEKGAYTGAHSARAGLIEESDGGTLFLDEIAEMGGSLQSKLLRVLQEREVRRLGSASPRPVDFRLVSATHRDIDRRVAEGQFRSDLLFRIDVVRIELPPLRERSGDVSLLAHHFLKGVARAHGGAVPPMEPATLEVLERFPWPGNVRELRNEIERAYALSPDRIGPESLSPRLRQTAIPHPLSRQIRDQIGSDLGHLERVVCGGVVRDVLLETGGNKAEAARRLGIPKTNLYRRLERYGIPFEKRAP